MFLLSVLVVLMLCYYCSNIIVSLFLSFVPSFSLRWQVDQKLRHAVQKTDSVCLMEKFTKNHQIIFLIWIFLKVCSIQLDFFRLFWVFWFELQKFPEKIIYCLLVCFSQILPCFALLQFCKSCACFFFAKPFGNLDKQYPLLKIFVYNKG